MNLSSTRHFLKLLTLFFSIIIFDLKAASNSVLVENNFSQLDTASDKAKRAYELYQQIKNNNSLIDNLSELNFTTALPVGISKTIGPTEYTIAIDSMSFDELGGKIGMYMSLEVLGSGKRLAFGARNIRFDEKGVKAGTKLMLLSNEKIGFGSNSELTIKGENGLTFINIDCDGFQGMSIDADLQFGNNLMLPEDDSGNVVTGKFVTASFQAQMASWGDLIAKISLTPFQLTALPRFGFKVIDATFDYSDISNPSGIIFPTSYSSEETGNTWQGISIKEVSVRVPNEFKGKDNGPIRLTGKNLIIDDIGLSGNFSATNLLSLEAGKVANWQFSIDSVSVNLQANQLIAGSLAGKIVIPVIDKTNPLGYHAIVHPGGDYAFQVFLTGNLPVSMWAAKMDLYANSSITVEYIQKKLLPKANLNGKITVSPSGDASASFADLTFQGLQVQTIQPLIKVDAFDLSSPKAEQAMAGFPVSLKNIHVNKSGNTIGLSFDVLVNLVGEGTNSFKADAGLIVWGEMTQNQVIASWKFKGVEVSSISIDIDQGAFKLEGLLVNYKSHPVFGKGFKGSVNAEFTPGLKVMATAQFGTVNSYRYWYADASLVLPAGIPIVPGFGLYGFGGGAYYHMKKEIDNPVALSMSGTSAPADTSKDAGKTQSGIRYVPDEATGLGIRATVFVGLMPSEPFNGSATFEVAFRSNGGVRSIALEGKGYFMNTLGQGSSSAPVRADLNIAFDFQNHSLHGLMNAYINLPGVVRGTGPDNRAGQVVIHFDPVDWYVYVGHPDWNRRIGLNLVSLFNINAYFVIGTEIPEMPPPPPQVTKILRMEDSRDDGLIGRGGGFAFGASLDFGADLTFLIFYAKLQAGVGFDVMLKNYGMDAHCAGTSGAVGINGWYAKGQAYAYFQGEFGIKVDMAFVKGQFTIMSAAAAVLMQANLPNPTWLFGKAACDYDILGGLVSGHMEFEMEFGKKCKLEGTNALAGIKVISTCSPSDGEQKVNVFNAPQATFNMALNKTFEIKDANDQNRNFRIMLDYFKLTSEGKSIDGTLDWNSRNDVVAFNATDVLPGEKTVAIEVKVRFEEQVNGTWKSVMNGSSVAGESFSSSFVTGPEPDYIVKSNIKYTYPLERQFNFYKDEYGNGYIALKQGQTKPFTLDPGFKAEGRLTATDGSKVIFNYAYNTESKTVSFAFPSGIKTGTVYNLQLLKVPSGTNAAVDNNVTAKVETQSTGNNSTNIKTQDVQGTLDLLQEKTIYDNAIRTSKYSTFTAKMNALEVSPGWDWSIMTGVDVIGVNVKGDELFDSYELGNAGIDRLITTEAKRDNNWLNNKIVPVIYPQYPLVSNMYLDWSGRTPTDELGVPPLKAIFIKQPVNDKLLEDSELTSGVGDVSLSFTEIDYDLVQMSYKDYVNLQNKAAVHSLRYSDSNLVRLMTTPFSNILKGSYGLTLKYVLPGLKTVTSSKDMTISW